jgi:hypothetical protein
MDTLRAAGVTITLDWIKLIEGVPANSLDALGCAQQAALGDITAVRTADVVWIVTPKSREHGCGLWVEMGAALAYGVPVVISGPQANRSIFAALAERHEGHGRALDAVLRKTARASAPLAHLRDA